MVKTQSPKVIKTTSDTRPTFLVVGYPVSILLPSVTLSDVFTDLAFEPPVSLSVDYSGDLKLALIFLNTTVFADLHGS